MPEIVPKSIQTWFEQVLGQIFRKVFAQFSMECRVFETFQKKIKKFSKFQPKTHKTVPKRIQRCFEHVLGQFFRKILAQFSMGGRNFENFQKSQKNFKIPKMPEIVPKSIQTWFEQVLGQIFRKIFDQFSMECRVFETFQKKIKKFSKITPKTHQTVPKESKSVLNRFLGKFFEKFLPSFPWSVESSKLFKKNQKIFKIPTKNAQNRSQKNPKVF